MLKNIKSFSEIKEALEVVGVDPGTALVQGRDYQIDVKSRNYQPINQPLPDVIDDTYNSTKIYKFLDETGSSEEFNQFLKESEKRSGKQVTDWLKEKFGQKVVEWRKS